MILETLFKLGVPTLKTAIYTPLPATAELQVEIAKQLPTQIGRIYGLSIYTDTVTPDQKNLITTTDSMSLYLTLKEGMANFLEDMRLDDMLYTFTGVPSNRPVNYFPCNIPNSFDLSTSFYSNPAGIVAGANNKTIALNLFYISIPTYNRLVKKNILMENGELAEAAYKNT